MPLSYFRLRSASYSAPACRSTMLAVAMAALFGCQTSAPVATATGTSGPETAPKSATPPGSSQQPSSPTPSAQEPTTAAGADPAQQPFEQSQTYYQVLLGQLALQRGEQQVALTNFLTAAEASRDKALARQALGLALKLRDPEATLRAARLVSELEPANTDAHLALALALVQTGHHQPALQALTEALAVVGDNEDGQLALLSKFARAGGPATLPLLAELSRQHPHPEWLLLAAAVQAQHFGDSPYAMALLDQAMERAPDYLRALLVKAELLSNRDGETAIALLKEAHSKTPGNRELTLAYGRTLYGQGRFPEAVAILAKPAKTASDKDANYLYAVSLFMAGDWEEALPRLRGIADAGEQTGPAGWLCGQAAERLGQIEEALRCYERVQPADNQYSPARRASAELLSKADRHDDALALLEEARLALDGLGGEADAALRLQTGLLASQLRVLAHANRFNEAHGLYASEPVAYRQQPEPALLVAMLGLETPAEVLAAFAKQRPETADARQQWALTGAGLLQQKGWLDGAFALLEQELAEQPEALDLLYARALVAEPLGRHDRSEADLRQVLALDPNHVDALNALGYTLADHNRQLDEALDLIQRAHRARPTSAAIMDSLGWVHYRRGELKQARDWLRRAYGLEPEAEIAAHYGEVLYQLGERKSARQIWQRARRYQPDNAVLNAVLERFQ